MGSSFCFIPLMQIGTVLFHKLKGKLVVTKKAYSPVTNSVVWFALDEIGQEVQLDGTETKSPQNAKMEQINPFQGVSMIKGEKGDQGDRGPIGLKGRDGLDGKDGKDGLNGQDGKDGLDGKDGVDGEDGKDGKDGLNGLSAFEIAKEKGFKGTKAEWLKSLKGDPGKDGKDGKDGLPGRDGGGGIHEIKHATDVKVTTPTNGQALVWNDNSKKWENGSVSGSGVVETIVAGANITVDDTDPANPIISSTGGTSEELIIAYAVSL